MAQYDLTGEALTGYRSATPAPGDFDEFWSRTLEQTRSHPLDARFDPVPGPFRLVEVFDVSFAGWDGQRVRGWLRLPRGSRDGAGLPVVVEFVGYGGGRGLAHQASSYATAGWAHLTMDTRGQGSGWGPGDTPDPDSAGDPQSPGFMTRGVLDPHTHYYRRVYADAVRAVETARSHPAVDPERVAVAGGSQGGGIAIAVAGMVPGLLAALPDVAFLCDMRRAVTMVDTDPYQEIVRYCSVHREQVDRVLATLDYFDGVHHAARATAPSLWSVALMDDICPPSTVYAAHNAWAGPKQMVEYPFNRHEGGAAFHELRRLEFLDKIFG